MSVESSQDELILDVEGIKQMIPHRYPFLFVDKVVEFVDNERIVGIKNVTGNEPFFQGHFPERAVMPGVIVMEALAQTAAILAKKSTDGVALDKLLYFVGADEFKWKRQVVPGDTLVLEIETIRYKSTLWKVRGTASVRGNLVSTGILTAAVER